MFDKFKAMGALAGLMKNQDGLKAAGARIQQKMLETIVRGEGGGGAVLATVRGDLRVLGFQIDPALAAGMGSDETTRRLAESLLADAVNDGLAKAQAVMRETVAKEARDLGLPEPPAGGLGALGSLLS